MWYTICRLSGSFTPSNRISAAEALTRFPILRSSLRREDLLWTRERELLQYPLIPRNFWRMFIDSCHSFCMGITRHLVSLSYIFLISTLMPTLIGYTKHGPESRRRNNYRLAETWLRKRMLYMQQKDTVRTHSVLITAVHNPRFVVLRAS
jgi:hypothetical protein